MIPLLIGAAAVGLGAMLMSATNRNKKLSRKTKFILATVKSNGG